MKKLIILSLAIMAFGTGLSAQNSFPHRWNIGESLGMGFSRSNDDVGLMYFDLSFSHSIDNTKWRWGVAAGMLLPAVMDYKTVEQKTKDEFLFSSYLYLLGFADYALFAGDKTACYLHGGLAPCYQLDKWLQHVEKKWSAMSQLGIGMDYGHFRMGITAFVTIYGDVGGFFSCGFYFGKKRTPNNI